jgi:hypothetical protein
VKARKHRRLNGALQEVNDHEDEAVARDCAVASIVDVVIVRPELHDKSKRAETPVHCEKNRRKLINFCEISKFFFKLTLRVAVEKLSISNANTVVVVQINFDLICCVTESKYRNFCVDQ